MPTGYSLETIGVLDGTKTVPDKSPGTVVNAGVKRLRATFDLSLASVAKAIADNNVIGDLPRGAVFAFGVINASVTMGAVATIAIGSVAAPAKYRAAALKMVVGPEMFGNIDASRVASLDINERIIFTIAAAALPGAGLLEIDIYYSSRS